jgi:cation:H+ antiporter
MILSLITITVATYIIWKISRSFDFAASFLTRNLSEGIKGPTVNAIASSLPELFISAFFLFYIGEVQGFSAGFATIIGSSIFNIAIIPSISFLYIYYKQGKLSFPTDRDIILQDGIFLIITIIVLLIGLYFGGISIALSSCLIILYIIYIFWIIYERSKVTESSTEKKITLQSKIKKKQMLNSEQRSLALKIINLDCIGLFNARKYNTKVKSIGLILISVILISFSCQLLVESSQELAEYFNINLFFITFFITAIASSIPDTILSVKDAKNENYKDSFSNAYGSNIFDICIGIGLPVLIYLLVNNVNEIPIPSYSNNILIFISAVLLLLFTIIITFIYWIKDINIYRTILVIGMYIMFLGSVYYISIV